MRDPGPLFQTLRIFNGILGENYELREPLVSQGLHISEDGVYVPIYRNGYLLLEVVLSHLLFRVDFPRKYYFSKHITQRIKKFVVDGNSEVLAAVDKTIAILELFRCLKGWALIYPGSAAKVHKLIDQYVASEGSTGVSELINSINGYNVDDTIIKEFYSSIKNIEYGSTVGAALLVNRAFSNFAKIYPKDVLDLSRKLSQQSSIDLLLPTYIGHVRDASLGAQVKTVLSRSGTHDELIKSGISDIEHIASDTLAKLGHANPSPNSYFVNKVESQPSTEKCPSLVKLLKFKKYNSLNDSGSEVDTLAVIEQRVTRTNIPIFRENKRRFELEVILLVDLSGSMRDKIVGAARAANLLQGTLPNCKVFGFNSTQAGITNITEFTGIVAAETDGGTPLHSALEFVRSKFTKRATDKVLFTITDGEPSFSSRDGEDIPRETLIGLVKQQRELLNSSGVKTFFLVLDSDTEKLHLNKMFGPCRSITTSDLKDNLVNELVRLIKWKN